MTQRSALPSREVDTTFSYDHFANRTTETNAAGIATVGYDAASHTDHRNEADGAGVSYAYDGLDRLVRRLDSTNTTTLFFHDGMSDQVSMETDATGVPKARYVLDAAGTPVATSVVNACPARTSHHRTGLTEQPASVCPDGATGHDEPTPSGTRGARVQVPHGGETRAIAVPPVGLPASPRARRPGRSGRVFYRIFYRMARHEEPSAITGRLRS